MFSLKNTDEIKIKIINPIHSKKLSALMLFFTNTNWYTTNPKNNRYINTVSHLKPLAIKRLHIAFTDERIAKKERKKLRVILLIELRMFKELPKQKTTLLEKLFQILLIN